MSDFIKYNHNRSLLKTRWMSADSRLFMKTYRLNRLFNAKSNRCFDVAIDHGFFNEFSFLAGIEDLGSAVKTLVAAAPMPSSSR